MARRDDIEKLGYNAKSIFFPALLLVLTPIFDIVRAVTGNLAWSALAFWSAFIGVNLALVTFLPMLVDWLALERASTLRRKWVTPIRLQALSIALFVLGVWLRLAHNKVTPSMPANVLADAGAAAWIIAALSCPVPARASARAGRWRSAT